MATSIEELLERINMRKELRAEITSTTEKLADTSAGSARASMYESRLSSLRVQLREVDARLDEATESDLRAVTSPNALRSSGDSTSRGAFNTTTVMNQHDISERVKTSGSKIMSARERVTIGNAPSFKKRHGSGDRGNKKGSAGGTSITDAAAEKRQKHNKDSTAKHQLRILDGTRATGDSKEAMLREISRRPSLLKDGTIAILAFSTEVELVAQIEIFANAEVYFVYMVSGQNRIDPLFCYHVKSWPTMQV